MRRTPMQAPDMSSFRHDRRQPDQQPPRPPPKNSSRIPTRQSSSSTERGETARTTQHVSQLARKPSKNIRAAETAGKSSTTKMATPETGVPQTLADISRRASVVGPPGTTFSSGPPDLRTPSLVSGSSVSTYDSPRSVLRRKPSGAIDRYAGQMRAFPTRPVESATQRSQSRNESGRELFDGTVLGISLPTTSPSEEIYVSLDSKRQKYDGDVVRGFTPHVPSPCARSTTPSTTRYTDSPFSHAPTISSASSYSPAMVATASKAAEPGTSHSSKRSRPAPGVRAPVNDRPSTLGLPPVREASTSSSNSTPRPESRLVQSKHAAASKALAIQRAEKSTASSKPSSRSLPQRSASKQSQNEQQTVHVYPELAHLNVDPPTSKTLVQKPLPPSRPTRDGTANICDMNTPSPVVQSDLPRLYTAHHKRNSSQETPALGTSPSLRTRFGLSPKSPPRNESPRIDSALSPPPAARNFHQAHKPEVPKKESSKLRRKDSPIVSEGSSPAKTPRFGIFSRKPRPEPPKVLEKPKRQPSKGPAAGTGHEGYGRFGFRSRSGSISSSNGVRSPSADSGTSRPSRPPPPRRKSSSAESKDSSELDEFLKERLNPITLRGSGSAASNAGSASDVGTDIYQASSKSSLDSAMQPRLLPSAIQDMRSGSPARKSSLNRPQISDSSDDDMATRHANIATRRSLTRLSSSETRSPVHMPRPINTNIPPQQPSIDSYDTETSAWPQTDTTLPPADHLLEREGLWLRSPQSELPIRSPQKWNFFQRATASPHGFSTGKTAGKHEVSSVPAHRSSTRAVHYYAMLDPVEPVGLDEAEQIAQETSAEDSMPETFRRPQILPYEERQRRLLPSSSHQEWGSDSEIDAKSVLPRIQVEPRDSTGASQPRHPQSVFAHQTAEATRTHRASVESYVDALAVPAAFSSDDTNSGGTREPPRTSTGTPESVHDSPRPPRLSPVGRIPAVISRRDRDRKLPNNSFSRPFARAQPKPSVKPPGSVYNQIRDMASPGDSSSQPVSSTSTHSDSLSADPKSSTYDNSTSMATNRTSMDLHRANEFLAFPTRKDSDQSSQSRSSMSGNPNWMAAMYMQPPQQDDVWHEYNDFVDEMLPIKTPTTGSSLGAPFQYSSMLLERNNYRFPPHSAISQPPNVQLPRLPDHAQTDTASDVLSVPHQISRLLRQALPSPMTPDTVIGLLNGYGSRSTSTLLSQSRRSYHNDHGFSTQPPDSARSGYQRSSATSSWQSRGSVHSRAASLYEASARTTQTGLIPIARPPRDSALLDIAEKPADDARASASLRFGALLTSKWLSFGRILFSPAHNEVQLALDAKVLVVDGLGSDWSHYVALSYPSAEVYNLTTSTPGSPSFTWPDVHEKPPPNHRQIRLAAIDTPFPFPRGFFTAVVFRFPMANTEQAYAACISECKRVLRPGGNLEVAVLDLDLMNMGTRSRKAVRDLKTRMQARDQAVSLRNLSDILVRLIGRRGFESVQRCIVGVPAAGRIPRSQDLSSTSSDSSGKVSWQREARSTKSQEFSFADLLEDAGKGEFGPGKNNDETITKMVAKVGRWWYSTCYEKALLPSDRSIWKDHALLRECERQGTSFRLLICHAQKPTQTRRRTVSV